MADPNRSQPETWSAAWDRLRLTSESVRKLVAREQRTLRWQAIREAFLARFGTLKGLRTIELGAGTGDISLLLALEGAAVSLFDASEKALEIARYKLSLYDIEAAYVVGDLFSLPAEHVGRYDAAVSYGVVEHFTGEDRFLACDSHARCVRPGGAVAISVPNARCLPYRLNKLWLETTAQWEWGIEVPYTRGELFGIAGRMNLKDAAIHGSSFLRDWDQFLLNPVTQRIEKYTGFHFERKTPLDDRFGHALTLIAST